MATGSKNTPNTLENKPTIGEEKVSEGTKEYLQKLNNYEAQGPLRPPTGQPVATISWWRGITSPLVVLFVAVIVMVALVFFGFGASATPNQSSSSNTASSSANSTSMGSTTSTNTAPSNVPNATLDYGNELAKYTIDPDGAKHFTLTTMQVMWEPVKGHRQLAWTINGTVPGPMIRVTAGDHIRVTFINHFPEATAIHWHGLRLEASIHGTVVFFLT